MGRSLAKPWQSSRATSVSSRNSSWTKGLIGPSSGQLRGWYGLEPRRERVVDDERDEVREGADGEEDRVAPGGGETVQDVSREPGEEHAAHRARHAPEPDHGGHVLLGEHVGDGREQ